MTTVETTEGRPIHILTAKTVEMIWNKKQDKTYELMIWVDEILCFKVESTVMIICDFQTLIDNSKNLARVRSVLDAPTI